MTMSYKKALTEKLNNLFFWMTWIVTVARYTDYGDVVAKNQRSHVTQVITSVKQDLDTAHCV